MQFVKSGKWKTGERKLADHLGIEWHTLGDGFTWESTDLDETAAKGRHAWEVAAEKLASGDYDLLILDELTYVVKYGWVPVDEVVAGLARPAPRTNVVVTGRDAPDELDRGRRHGHRDAQGQARHATRASRPARASSTEREACARAASGPVSSSPAPTRASARPRSPPA